MKVARNLESLSDKDFSLHKNYTICIKLIFFQFKLRKIYFVGGIFDGKDEKEQSEEKQEF